MEEPSKPFPSVNVSSVSVVRGDGEVLHQSRKITKAEIDDLDPLVLHEAKDLAWGALLHMTTPSEISRAAASCGLEANEIRLVPITGDAVTGQLRARVHQLFTMAQIARDRALGRPGASRRHRAAVRRMRVVVQILGHRQPINENLAFDGSFGDRY